MTIVTIVLYNVKLFVLSSFCVRKTEKVLSAIWELREQNNNK